MTTKAQRAELSILSPDSKSILRVFIMRNIFLATIIAISSLAVMPEPSCAAESHGEQDDIVLSLGVLNLLREEMREIAAGVKHNRGQTPILPNSSM